VQAQALRRLECGPFSDAIWTLASLLKHPLRGKQALVDQAPSEGWQTLARRKLAELEQLETKIAATKELSDPAARVRPASALEPGIAIGSPAVTDLPGRALSGLSRK
jgi:hypothetical protein